MHGMKESEHTCNNSRIGKEENVRYGKLMERIMKFKGIGLGLSVGVLFINK